MEKNNTKLFLEVDASQIDVKQLLKKDFLELSMRAISSANPNRNNSWFTRESMEKSIGSFINKPILGYFENGDFVSHNGDWDYDSETEMSYWDTLGKKGERILGIIRESDEVKIVEDSKGLSWVTFTCALWTQYSFKQVKRLIKDAKRAQKTGESTKNISVEVDITDYEMLDNGIMKINEFNLVGVTILGTRNGVKVEPGIEDAELSVVDIMGREIYSTQEKSLRLAYEKLNNSIVNKEESKVENEEIKQTESLEELSTNEPTAEPANYSDTEGLSGEAQSQEVCATLEEVCPDCGKNPCECAKDEENAQCEDNKPEECEQSDPSENKEPEKEAEGPESKPSDEPKEGDDGNKEDEASGKCEDQGDAVEKCSQSVEEQCESEQPVVNSYTEEQYMELHSKYEELLQENNRLQDELANAMSKVNTYEHKEFVAKAADLIASAKLDDVMSSKFMLACEQSEIKTIEDLKVKVAVAVFDAQTEQTTESATFTAPVSTPDVTSVFEDNAPVKVKKGDHWSALHDYIGK